MTYPTQQRLRELFRYDDLTGELLRRDGKSAGSLTEKGRYRCQVDDKKFYRSTLVWIYHNGQAPTQQLDHRDDNQANDRIENLRDVSQATNMQNQTRMRAHNTSGYQGVTRQKNGFQVMIRANGQRIYLGYFADAEVASAAYQAAKRVYHV